MTKKQLKEEEAKEAKEDMIDDNPALVERQKKTGREKKQAREQLIAERKAAAEEKKARV